MDQVCYNTARALDACKKDGVSISSLMVILSYPPMPLDAIMMALSNPNTQLIAIICVQGRVGVNQMCYNTARALDACKKDGVSITSLMLILPSFPRLRH